MTAILQQRCDPFGVEREKYGERLGGGLFDEAGAGKYIWHCDNVVIGRYRLICTGGHYGFRRENGGGIAYGYQCKGGHASSEPMYLCKVHVLEGMHGPPKPGWSADLTTSYGQVGGTNWTDCCPACVAPPSARTLMNRADFLHKQLSGMRQALGAVIIPKMMARAIQVEAELDQVRAEINELHERGLIHKCPLKLVEVS